MLLLLEPEQAVQNPLPSRENHQTPYMFPRELPCTPTSHYNMRQHVASVFWRYLVGEGCSRTMAKEETTAGVSTSAYKFERGRDLDGRFGPVHVWQQLLSNLRGITGIRKCKKQLPFFSCSSEKKRDIYRKEYWVDISDCCLIWNWGFHCSNKCDAWHVCSQLLCRTIFDDDHRAI